MATYEHNRRIIANLDAISRTRALSEAESLQLEYAIKSVDEVDRRAKIRGSSA